MEDKIEVCGRELRFVMQPGVFAKNGIDYGSRLLLEVLTKRWFKDGAIEPTEEPVKRNVVVQGATIEPTLAGAIEPKFILDLGCGCGVLGISLASCFPEAKVYMVDADIRAIRNSRVNAKLNEIKNVDIGIGDWTDNLPEGLKFDLVVSNPPTHQGREVLEKFFDDSCKVLKRNGELWIVMNRMTSVIKQLEKRFERVENVKNKKGYMVVRSLKK